MKPISVLESIAVFIALWIVSTLVFNDQFWQVSVYLAMSFYWGYWATKYNDWIEKLKKKYGPTAL